MSWEDVDISTVKPTLEVIPVGNYTFQLSGGKYDENKPGKIVVSSVIASQGEFLGRKVTFTYPDPAAQKWSPTMFARLRNSLGVDAYSGEDPVEYLNRAKGSLFSAPVRHRSYFKAPDGTDINQLSESQKEAYKVVVADLDIFNVGVASGTASAFGN